MGVNAPDVDVFSGFGAEYQALAFRRGWTHGVLALALWPFVLTGVLLLWDRYVRLKRKPDAAPARAGPLLKLTALAVLTHPGLDWLNNYGIRWLMPFDGTWFYGDALFVIDPWFWLLVGGAAFLTFSQSRLAKVRWAVFASLATALIVASAATTLSNAAEVVPAAAAVMWVVGIAALVAARWRLRAASPATLERAAQAGLAFAAVYVVALLVASAAARSEVREAARARDIAPEDVLVAPRPANPFVGDVVVATRDEYWVGRFDWLAAPRASLEEQPVPRARGAAFQLAAEAPAVRRFLKWARYPAVDVEPKPDGGTLVRFTDVRYRAADRLSGPVVELPAGAVEPSGD